MKTLKHRGASVVLEPVTEWWTADTTTTPPGHMVYSSVPEFVTWIGCLGKWLTIPDAASGNSIGSVPPSAFGRCVHA